jgi:hypothetical protein
MCFVRRRQKWCGLLSVLLLAACLGGCGDHGPYPVEGKVVWEDGSPAKELENSQVVFELPEKGTSARGVIQADGTFRLSTVKPNDGALPGEHKVVIVENRKYSKQEGSPMVPAVMEVRYNDPKTSDLKATVTSGTNSVTLKVERARRR